MIMPKNISMKTHLSLVIGLALTLSIIISVLGYTKLSNTASLLSDMGNIGLRGDKLLSDANNAIWELRFSIANYTLANVEARKKNLDSRPPLYLVVETSIKEYSNLHLTLEQKETLKEFNTFYTQYKDGAPKWFSLIDENKMEEAAEYRSKVTNLAGSEMVKRLKKLLELQVKHGNDLQITSQDDVQTAKSQIVTISLILLLITSFAAIVIIKTMLSSVSTLQKGLLSFFAFLNRENSHANKITLESKDEFGMMASIINENIEKIEQGLLSDAQTVTDALNVANKVKAGYLHEVIHSNPNNPQLKELKDVLNEMIMGLNNNIKNILQVLNLYAINDFTPSVDKGSLNGEVAELAEGVNKLGHEISSMLRQSLDDGKKPLYKSRYTKH